MMRSVLATLAVLAALALAGAGAVVGFGLYNVSARTGHLPGVSWVLHTTFRNSVRLRAPPVEAVPPLGDPDLIALGAGHYATACAPCHTVPGGQRSATVRAMLPEPPPIGEAVAHWRPNELHWIVENGVKMSGMPGWPVAERGDEIWAVVAYLEAVKDRSAPPVPSATLTGAAYCRSCHGRIGGPVPRLDLQDADYLSGQLDAYLSGKRSSGIMAQAVSLVPRESLDALAQEFAAGGEATTPSPDAEDGTAGATNGTGAQLASRGTRDVPACLACHGGSEPRKGPVLFGQSQAYLSDQLRLWRDGINDHNPLMRAATRELTDDDIDLLSRYFAAGAP